MSTPEPDDLPGPPPPCPICNGFGVLEDRATRRLVPCRCKAKDASASRLAAAGIPDRYRNCTIENFNHLTPSQAAAKALARRFVDEFPGVGAGLLISGTVGVGKTHLAVAILKELIETKEVRGVFLDFGDLLDRIQASFARSGEESQDEIVEPYRDAQLLVLDELGARRPTPWAREVLYGLLNTRYNRRRVTILTTNFVDRTEKPDEETLESRIGVAVRSRLAEMCQLVTVAGPDYRREVRPGRVFS